MVSWKATNKTLQDAYETAVRALGAEPTVTDAGDNLVEVTADLPSHYEAAIRMLIKGSVSPGAITHGLVASAADTMKKSE